MKNLIISGLLSLSMMLTLTGCSNSTNSEELGGERRQLLLASDEEVLQFSIDEYNKELEKAKNAGILDTNKKQLARLQRIADRLIAQVGSYREDALNWNWEVHIIDSQEMNAYAMAGGKIMFYSAMLNKDFSDDEIAAIMGHEIAHALREHSRESLSNEVATQAGIGIVANVLGLSENQINIAQQVGEIGINRRHSRVQESEADKIGLVLMAKAGYNPESAITLWQKFSQMNEHFELEFLSTHPSHETRISQLQALLPQVMPYYTAIQKQ